MQIKLIPIAIIICILAACATPPPRETLDAGSSSLAEASYSVSRSLVNLSEVAQASRPLPYLGPQPDPRSIGMGALTSVDWAGPIEPLVRQLARVSHYRVRVLGRPPAIPVLVSVYAKEMVVADILRDVGFQAGRRAMLVVYPDSRVIELRYAKN